MNKSFHAELQTWQTQTCDVLETLTYCIFGDWQKLPASFIPDGLKSIT